jgi:hypothetical protein
MEPAALDGPAVTFSVHRRLVVHTALKFQIPSDLDHGVGHFGEITSTGALIGFQGRGI